MYILCLRSKQVLAKPHPCLALNFHVHVGMADRNVWVVKIILFLFESFLCLCHPQGFIHIFTREQPRGASCRGQRGEGQVRGDYDESFTLTMQPRPQALLLTFQCCTSDLSNMLHAATLKSQEKGQATDHMDTLMSVHNGSCKTLNQGDSVEAQTQAN